MADRLTGKIAVVTGAAMGIGFGVAELLAQRGARVAMVDMNGQELERRARELGAAGLEVLPVQASVAKQDDVASAFRRIAAEYGGVDVIVNCAGVARYGDAESLSLEDWDLQIGTNLTSVFLTAKYGVPYMRERAGGVIVAMASVQAFASQHGVAAYSASKGGVVALVRSLALDFAADGIRAVAIAPGSVDTPMLRASAQGSATATTSVEDILDAWGRNHPLGRLLEPVDVANLVAFLASDEAAMITGTTVTIDGGLLCQIAVQR